ncbi:MAG: alpha/beta fold hydrolase [Pseudomonadota bacterium]
MIKINRRTAMLGGAATLAAPSLVTPASSQNDKPHICLVNGAWHGAWAWTRLMPLLIEAGYPVSAPELSGLGANSHRQSPEIGMRVHGQDVLNHLYFNDVRDAVVVGHSYGGCVLSQALAGDKEGRIAHAVYLDALVPGNGQALVSFVPTQVRKNFEKAAADGAMIPPRPRDLWEKMWGLTGETAEFAGPRLRPMSARCFTESVEGDPFERDVRLSFMRCTQNDNPLFDMFSEKTKADPRFNHVEIDGHHDVMVINPPLMLNELVAIV